MAILPPNITIVVELKPGNAAETLWKILEEARALDAAAEERMAAQPYQEDPEYRYQECPVCASRDQSVRIQNAAGQPCTADWHPANRPRGIMLDRTVRRIQDRAQVAGAIGMVLDKFHADPFMRDREEIIAEMTEAVMSQLGRDAPGS